MRAGREWDEADRHLWWNAYYDWLERMLFAPGRWAIMPDSPAAPSQLNDGLLNDWPFGDRGAPVWHMDGSIERLARLCERHPRVCVGWIGDPKKEPVGCEAYFRKMDEVAALMGNTWHPLHMLRGILVARQYPFVSVDSTSLAQNGHRYDQRDQQVDILDYEQGSDGIWRWRGRNAYADRLEQGHFTSGIIGKMRANRATARRGRDTSPVRLAVERGPLQLGLL
ncbi:hypothetical protein [Sphingopyxis sp. C-1]|uniref:hypothetical protein n=1 Tax=Sphingopyxis sp. C-1 TaxID=262667 RepID=UPI000A65CF4F|nr:hypothetical protein [Sphingopyxis sp. C-1]